jgi:hypothetical protein
MVLSKRSKRRPGKIRPQGASRRDIDVPKIVPPRSVFRLVRSDRKTPSWKADIGRLYRIGYYSRQDGLDIIWLVNEKGKYEQTAEREHLLKYFEVVKISDETNLYGVKKRRLGPVRSKSKV